LQCIDGRCDLPRGEGLPCTNDLNCEMGLRCGQSLTAPGLSCQQKLPNGEPCDGFTITDDDCASGFCDTVSDFCTASVSVGGLCPSARDQQCADGYCETEFIACTNDDQCLGSGSCNLISLRCEFHCVAALPDGAMCERAGQCMSEACVDQFCRTVPLADGEPCSSALQCESGFCSFDVPRVCATPPLENGRGCSNGDECESGICFQLRCVAGLGEGERCDDPFNFPPCGAELFCDAELQPPECVPVLEPGEDCDAAFQCRSQCVQRFARQMCDATPAPQAAICDGPE
jgi:hypothetical protein